MNTEVLLNLYKLLNRGEFKFEEGEKEIFDTCMTHLLNELGGKDKKELEDLGVVFKKAKKESKPKKNAKKIKK